MDKVILCIAAAVVSYLVSGLNPSIILSKLVYHRDIRECGSGNPGFTNFKRTFGSRYAWFVFALDILKSLVLCIVFGFLFRAVFGSFALGAAYSCFFSMLGHCFPVWYGFEGGKGFLVCAAAVWFVDWRAALIAFVIMNTLLFTVKYMSLSVIIAALSVVVSLIFFRPDHWAVLPLVILCVALLIWRHRENIVRLMNGTERKFSLGSRREDEGTGDGPAPSGK